MRGELPPDPERIFRASLVDPEADVAAEAARFRPAFRHLALLVQVPGVDLEARVAAEKGAPLDDAERAILGERARRGPRLAGRLRARSATGSRCATDLPAEAAGARPRRSASSWPTWPTAAEAERPAGGDAWQDLIFRCGQARGVSSRDAFAAVYAAFLGRANGPRAGWLLASLRAWASCGAPAAAAAAACGRGGGSGHAPTAAVAQEPEERHERRGGTAARGGGRIRQGAIDKGEDPALVDEALASTPSGASLLGEADALRAERKRSPSRSARPSRAAPTPQRPGGVAAARAVDLDRGRDRRPGRATGRGRGALDELLLRIPNPPDPGVPVGGEEASLIVRTWGEPAPARRAAADERRPGCAPHWEVAEALGMLDLAAGAKITGSGFPVYRAPGPRSSARSSTSSSTSTPASTA